MDQLLMVGQEQMIGLGLEVLGEAQKGHQSTTGLTYRDKQPSHLQSHQLNYLACVRTVGGNQSTAGGIITFSL